MFRFTSISLLLSTLLLVSIGSAQQTPTTAVPSLIRYSGTLKDAAGPPVGASIAATLGVTFAIYKQQDGGAPVWMETQNVTPDASGQYSVVLGSTTATGLPSDLFSQEEQRWLGVQVQGQAEQPRVLLVSVPYAFKAHEAETLGGLPASAFVQAAPTDTLADGSNGWNAPSNAGGPGGALRTKGKTASGKPNTSAPCVTIGGAGTLNFIPLWTPDGCTLGSSLISQLTAGRVDVNGNFNLAGTASAYQIGANNVLSIGSSADYNLFLGLGAGAHNVAGSGMFNVFSGYRAGYSNTAGTSNTFSGYKAGFSNTTGQANAFFGLQAGYSNTRGAGNVFSGYNAGFSNATGSFNVFSGYKTGDSNIGGAYNTFVGYAAGTNSNACCNTFAGSGAGDNNMTGSSNIYIGNEGPSTGTESNAIRIGTDGVHAFQQNRTYIAGISGATTNSGVPVFVDSTGKLGTTGGGGGNYIWNGTSQQPNANFNISGTGTANLFWANGFISAAEYDISGNRVLSIGSSPDFYNLFVGVEAGASNSTGYGNTFVGADAGGSNTTGTSNTFVGDWVSVFNTTGSGNAFFGYHAGMNTTTGNNNIYIKNLGCTYPCSESNTIRIGGDVGDGYGAQTVAYIAGIYGSVSSGGIPVYVNSDGKLGTQTSSLRFKEQVRDMGDSTSALMKLRPVTFLYKPEYDKGERTLQYGLIAEEVAKVYPELVAYDKDGQPYTVKYQYLAPMLLNEVQKQHAVIAAQQDVIKTQQKQIENVQQQNEEFEQRLVRLESLVARR